MKHRSLALAAIVSMAFAAVPYVTATETTAATSNAAPSVDALYYYGSAATAGSGASCAASATTSFNPSPGASRTIHVCFEVSDPNGWNDVCAAGSVRTFSVTDASDTAVATGLSLACATGSGTAATLIGSFVMEYWRLPGVSLEAYKVIPSVTDIGGATAGSFVGRVDWTPLKAIHAPTALSLGSALAPGEVGTEASAALRNHGNVAFTVQARATEFVGAEWGRTIPAASLRFALDAGTGYDAKTPLDASAATIGLLVPVETSSTPTDRMMYLQLGVPAGGNPWIPAGGYQGTLVFSTD